MADFQDITGEKAETLSEEPNKYMMNHHRSAAAETVADTETELNAR